MHNPDLGRVGIVLSEVNDFSSVRIENSKEESSVRQL